MWHKIKLRCWEYLDCFKPISGEIIVIDITNKSWVKQLGSVSNLDNTRITGIENIIKRHIVHCRCKSSIILKESSIYCEKCKYKIPSKSTCFKSSSGKFLKNENIVIGEALIDNKNKPILLIDLEYTRRREKII